MTVITKTHQTEYDETLGLLPSGNGLTQEQKERIIAAAGRHKDNPDFIKSGQEQVAEYRRHLQEQLERELADEGK